MAKNHDRGAAIPVAMLVLILMPLLLMPLAAVFVFAFRGGPIAFLKSLSTPDAQFAFRFSLPLQHACTDSFLQVFRPGWQ